MTGTTLFAFDTEREEVVERVVFDSQADTLDYFVGRGLKWVDDHFVGYSRCQLFEFYPADLEIVTLIEKSGPGCNGLGVDEQGRYYYGVDTEVFRWTPAEDENEPVCDRTISERHVGGFRVASGERVCLDGADVRGGIVIEPGGRLAMTDASVRGSVDVNGAESFEVRDSAFRGAVTVRDVSGEFIFSGSEVYGSLSCMENASEPEDEDSANTISGAAEGQCAGL